jgi:Putative addiction module component
MRGDIHGKSGERHRAGYRRLSREEKVDLIRLLIAELDAPADANVERAWRETSQRRYRELVEGKVTGVPGTLVQRRLRAKLRG